MSSPPDVLEGVAFLKRWVQVDLQEVAWYTDTVEPREEPVVWSGDGTVSECVPM